MKDYYRILEVSPSASFEVIKASYRALAKKYHPDTQTSSNTGTLRAEKSMINSTAVLLTAQNRVKKRFQEMTLALSLIRLRHPKKAAMSPIADMAFFRS